jgi:hypothetical protein
MGTEEKPSGADESDVAPELRPKRGAANNDILSVESSLPCSPSMRSIGIRTSLEACTAAPSEGVRAPTEKTEIVWSEGVFPQQVFRSLSDGNKNSLFSVEDFRSR